MLEKVKSYIKKNDLLKDGETVVLAYSSGVDSVVLLDILLKLKYKVVIAHVNHNLRKESIDEEIYTRNLAKKLNLPCEIYSFNHDGVSNFEASAHKERYEFLESVLKKYKLNTLLTAHHKNDNLESIIMKLFKGSNLYGYSGIVPNVIYENYHIIRPLLSLSKDEIYLYAKENNLKFFEDITNKNTDYKRNAIRHKIVPELLKESPNVLDKSMQFSERLLEAFTFLRKTSEQYLNTHNYTIDIPTYNLLDVAVKKDILTKMLEVNHLEFSNSLIDDLLKVIENNKPQLDYNLPNGFLFSKRYDSIRVKKEEINDIFSFKLKDINDKIDTGKFSMFFSKIKPLNNEKFIILCYNKIEWPLVVRNKENGDRISMSYGSKKLKDLFIDKKLLKESRDNAIVVNDNKSNILWVVDVVKSDSIRKFKNNGDIYLIWRGNNDE